MAGKQQLLTFAVEDASQWRKSNELRLEVEYLDSGPDSIFALYNSWYHSDATTEDVLIGNSGKWTSQAFLLRDVLLQPWASHAGGHIAIGPNRHGDLYLRSVRLLDVSKPKEAYEEVVAAYEKRIAEPPAEWLIPHYMMAMAEVLDRNLGRGKESWRLQMETLQRFPDSEVAEAWSHAHRTSRW